MAGPDRVEADHEAISGLRQEFDRFFYEQKRITERADWLIEMAIGDLENAEYKWEQDKQHAERKLEECEDEAAYAAMHGGYRDCSDWIEAIEECVRVLDILDGHLARLLTAVERYRSEQGALEQWFYFELPRVRSYFDDRIKALRAFLSEQM